MNDYIQNTKSIKKELEAMLSNRNTIAKEASVDVIMFCELMKQFYLSCSTNN